MQKRLNLGIIGLLVLVLCLIPALTGQNTGLAQNVETIPVDSPLPEPDPIILEYARTLGLSNEEAGQRLKLQNEMDALESKIREGEPTYAGSWTVHQPNFGLVVSFATPNGEEKIRKYLDGIEWANLVSVQQSPFT